MAGKRNIIFLWASIIGLLGILPLIQRHFMVGIPSVLRTREIPMGMINNGTLGKILKAQCLVRPVPNKNSTDLFQKKSYSSSTADFQIRLNTDKSSRLRVYWAGKNERYSQKRSTAVRIKPDRTHYRLSIPKLSTITRIRIDPSEKLARFRIRYIEISQIGFLPIRLDSENQFMKIKPLNGIDKLSIDESDLNFTTSGGDSQLELKLKPERQIYNSVFQKKRDSGNFYFTANPGGAATFPSSQVIDREDIVDGLPLISIVVDKNDLYDQNQGIFANPVGRGKDWEKLSYISYYQNKSLRFASAAGLRIHGGVSRKAEKKSYRLYFRNSVSDSGFPAGFLSDQKSATIKRMVVHLDRPTD